MTMSNRDTPLKVEIKDGEIVIRIGIDVLKMAAEQCPGIIDWEGEYDYPWIKIDDADEFAKDVVQGLLREEEDGSTTISDCFDEAIKLAVDDGSIGVDYDFMPKRIDPEGGELPARKRGQRQ